MKNTNFPLLISWMAIIKHPHVHLFYDFMSLRCHFIIPLLQANSQECFAVSLPVQYFPRVCARWHLQRECLHFLSVTVVLVPINREMHMCSCLFFILKMFYVCCALNFVVFSVKHLRCQQQFPTGRQLAEHSQTFMWIWTHFTHPP